jgi:hypothetical protein
MPSRTAAALRLAALAAAVVACAPRRPPPDLSLDPAALLAQVEAAQAKVTSVRGEARVAAEGEKFHGTVRELVAAEKPDRLRVDTLDFFGNPVAALAASGGRLGLYDARARVFYRGAATPENLARLVPLPLPADALVTILTGSAPLLRGRAADAQPGRGVVSLELEGADGRAQRLDVGAGASVVRSRRSGPGAYALAFDRFRRREGLPFPGEVALRADAPKVSVDLHWMDVEVNPKLDPAMFVLAPPRGARVVDLDRGGEGAPELYRGDSPTPRK